MQRSYNVHSPILHQTLKAWSINEEVNIWFPVNEAALIEFKRQSKLVPNLEKNSEQKLDLRKRLKWAVRVLLPLNNKILII